MICCVAPLSLPFASPPWGLWRRKLTQYRHDLLRGPLSLPFCVATLPPASCPQVASAKAACATLDRKRIAGQRRVYFMRHGECDHNMYGNFDIILDHL